MPDREFELEQLRLADQHITEAHERIAVQAARTSDLESTGNCHDGAQQLLAGMQGTLVEFERHRALIVQVLDDPVA